jgi:hypothetical protein
MPSLLLLVLLLLAGPAGARTLSVGPDQPFPSPSTAAHAARDGDNVLIEPGEYYNCAVWTQNHLTIAGARRGIVITDTTCQGEALFVITGDDTTVRDLTPGAGARRQRRWDPNGRPSLTLERVRFVNNQVGPIDGAAAAGAIRISDCGFDGGGVGGERPAVAVLVGAVSLLRIEDSTFKGANGGQINTLTARTELAGNQIGAGTGERPQWQ